MRKLMFYVALSAPLFLAACGGNQTAESENADMADSMSATLPDVAESTAAVSNTVELTANDQMKFSTTEIRVKAGEEVTLTLKNVGTMAKEAMGHNFLLLGNGTDIQAFAMKAMVANDSDYIPAGMESSILKHTKLLGPGESDTITFTVPAGSYDFICSFPGHYATMQGKLIAE